MPPPPGLDLFGPFAGEYGPFPGGLVPCDQLQDAKSPQVVSFSDNIEIHGKKSKTNKMPPASLQAGPSDKAFCGSFFALASPQSSFDNDKVRAQRHAAKKKDLLSQYSHHDGPIATLMICNIPCRITQQQLVDIIDGMGFGGKYDFLYLPTGGRSSTVGSSNLGYGFINYEDPADAELFQQMFTNYQFEGTTSTKVCTVRPAHIQGLQNNILHFDRTANKGRPRREGPFIRLPKKPQDLSSCQNELFWLEPSYFGFLDDDSPTSDYIVGGA